QHRVRTFERFDTLDVIEVAIVLHVVAHSIQEEISARAVTANDDLIAIVLTLVRRNTRNISDNVRNARHRLIANLFFGDYGDRLRNVAERCQRLCSTINCTDTVRVCDGDARARWRNLENDLDRVRSGWIHGFSNSRETFRGDAHLT